MDNTDLSIFRDGDFVVLTATYDTTYRWISILRSTPETNFNQSFIYSEDYCGMYLDKEDVSSEETTVWTSDDYSDSAQEIRLATKEEIQLFLDELHRRGFTWDVENKKVVSTRYTPVLENGVYNIHRFYAELADDININRIENVTEIKDSGYENLSFAKKACDELNRKFIHIEAHFYKDECSNINMLDVCHTYKETLEALKQLKPLVRTTSIANLDYAWLLELGYTVYLHENNRVIEMKDDMAEYSDKDIKPGHNIQKLWIGHHFDNYFYKK